MWRPSAFISFVKVHILRPFTFISLVQCVCGVPLFSFRLSNTCVASLYFQFTCQMHVFRPLILLLLLLLIIIIIIIAVISIYHHISPTNMYFTFIVLVKCARCVSLLSLDSPKTTHNKGVRIIGEEGRWAEAW